MTSSRRGENLGFKGEVGPEEESVILRRKKLGKKKRVRHLPTREEV